MDFYTLLGVSRSATSRRGRARVSPIGATLSSRASIRAIAWPRSMFRQIQQAYDVLADLDRRREYDRGAADRIGGGDARVSFDGFDFSAPAEGPSAGTFAELFADVFQDAAREATTPSRGADLEMTLRAVLQGRGARAESFRCRSSDRNAVPRAPATGRCRVPPAVCRECDGQGARRWARGHMVFTKSCDRVRGERADQRAGCRGMRAAPGCRRAVRSWSCASRRGSSQARAWPFPARGHAGARRGPAGDLYVTIEVADHRFFRRVGQDLHLTLPLAIHEAALGARIDVPTLGDPVRVRVPPGTAAGQRIRVRGPRRGVARRRRRGGRRSRARRPARAAAGPRRAVARVARGVRPAQRGRCATASVRMKEMARVGQEVGNGQGLLHDQRGGDEVQHPPADPAPL